MHAVARQCQVGHAQMRAGFALDIGRERVVVANTLAEIEGIAGDDHGVILGRRPRTDPSADCVEGIDDVVDRLAVTLDRHLGRGIGQRGVTEIPILLEDLRRIILLPPARPDRRRILGERRHPQRQLGHTDAQDHREQAQEHIARPRRRHEHHGERGRQRRQDQHPGHGFENEEAQPHRERNRDDGQNIANRANKTAQYTTPDKRYRTKEAHTGQNPAIDTALETLPSR